MDLQTLITTATTAGCALYAAWVLMPSAWRRALAAWLRRGRWPAPVARWFDRQASPAGGCGCSGCDGVAAKPGPTPALQPITLVRRPGRR